MLDGYKYAVFPSDFTEKFIDYICKEEVQTADNIKEIYGRSLLSFCERVQDTTCIIKRDGVSDCFELEDDNWCVPLSLIEVLD